MLLVSNKNETNNKKQLLRSFLDLKALATAARALDVGIVKDKLAAQLVAHVVHLGAEQAELSLDVHEELDARLLDNLVELLLLFGILERVGEAIAAALLDTNAHAGHRLRALAQQLLDALDSGRRERYGRLVQRRLARRLDRFDARREERLAHHRHHFMYLLYVYVINPVFGLDFDGER